MSKKAWLVIAPGELGDTLSFMPVLNRVRANMPSRIALHVVVIVPLKTLFEETEGIDKIYSFDDFADTEFTYDWILDFSGMPSASQFTAGCQYRHIVRRHFDGDVPEFSVDGGKRIPIEIFREDLSGIGGDPNLPAFMLEAPLVAAVFKEDIASCVFEKIDFPILKLKGEFGNRERSNSVYLIPGGTSKAKKWPIENYFELYQKLETEGFSPAFILGECEAFYLPLIRERGMRFYFNKDLSELAFLFNRAAFVIANDCGIMHLAAVLGTPTIAVFGPTNPSCWFYYERYAQNLFKSFQVAGTQRNPWGILKGISSWDMWPSVDSVFNYIKGANFLVSQDKD